MQLGPESPLGGFSIVAPFASSPAEEAGIRSGERLLAIDGLPWGQLTKDEAVTLMRGAVGSQVRGTLWAGGHAQKILEREQLVFATRD